MSKAGGKNQGEAKRAKPARAPVSPGASAAPAPALLFVDAIEGARARLLLGRDAFDVPVQLLPRGTREGSWVRLSLSPSAPPAGDEDGAALRAKLGRSDDGGDIEL